MKKFTLVIYLAICSYFTQAQTYYVDANASGANNGTSWVNAFTDLSLAINNTNSGELWVAAGTYYPGTSGNNNASFLMKDNLAIYGGFNGSETLLNERNPTTNVTILSGDLDLSGTATPNDAFHVVNAGNTGSTAILDGFTITMGYASGTFLDGSGAGLFCAPTVTGIYSPRIEHCKFLSNVATGDGGAIYINGYQTGGSITSPAINYCSFSSNSAYGYGAAIYIGSYDLGAAASPRFENCLFDYNFAGITGNLVVAVSGGNGELYPVLTNCTLYGNGTNDEIMYQSNGFPGSVTLNNCIAYNIDMYSNVTITANNTNANSPYISGTNNISADPQFVNPAGNDFRLQCFSPGVDLGDAGLATLSYDLDGNPRVSNATIDMGAYEGTFTFPAVTANASSTTICMGDAVNFTGSGDPVVSYNWSSGIFEGMPFYPSTTDTYTVTGTDASGCSGSAVITVTVNITPFISYNASSTAVCEGSPVTLSGTGGIVYSWDNGVSDNVPFSPLFSNTYSVIGTDANGCTGFSSVYVEVESAFGFTAGTDINACRNSGASVPLNPTYLTAASYTWTTSNGTGSFNNPIDPFAIYTIGASDNFLDTVKFVFMANFPACGIVSDSVFIVMRDLPIVTLPADYTICETDSIFLQGNVTGGNAPYTYNWTDGTPVNISNANNEMYLPLVSDIYTLNVSDQFGCFGQDAMIVSVDLSEAITGYANNAGTPLSNGIVNLYKFEIQNSLFGLISSDTLIPADNGIFDFPSVPFGDYLIKVIPDTLLFPNLIPTYYGNDFQWDSATVVTQNCITDFNANIDVIALLGGSGTGSVSGYIIEGVGFGLRLANGHNHIMVPGGPLKGIDVKLGKNPGGGIQARTTSDNTGHYEFNNLPDDSYRIYVDIPGLPMDSFYIVNVVSDSTTDLIYYADSNSVFPELIAVGIHQYTNASVSTFEMYPNPASSKTSLVFSSEKQNHATINVIDITGKQVMHITLSNLPKGKHEYQLNFTNQQLQSGIYFVELITENGKQTKKLIVE